MFRLKLFEEGPLFFLLFGNFFQISGVGSIAPGAAYAYHNQAVIIAFDTVIANMWNANTALKNLINLRLV